MGIKQTLISCIPPAYYSNGIEAKCMLFRVCNMFDIDSHSFKQVENNNTMNKKEKGEETKAEAGHMQDCFISDETEN